MKELLVYLHFLKSATLLLIIFSLIGIGLGYYFYQQQTVVYTSSQVFEVADENLSVDEKINVAEEVVGLLRATSIEDSDVQHLYISRVSPFAVKAILSSDNPQEAHENISDVSQFINQRAKFISVGEELTSVQKPIIFVYLVAGLAVGFGFGLCISLMKTYFKSY